MKVLGKIYCSDTWVVYDDVQFSKREWQNRCKIRHLNSEENDFFLTIPVSLANGRSTLINDVLIIDKKIFFERLVESIRHSYGKSRHYKFIKEYVDCIISKNDKSLVDMCVSSVTVFFDKIGHKVNIEYSSNMHRLNTLLPKSDKILDICKYNNTNTYLSGTGGFSYINKNSFLNNSIDVLVYGGNDFFDDNYKAWKNLSFIDYIAHNGVDNTISTIERINC